MTSSLVQVRVDDELKKQATTIYDSLGIDLSTAVRMFLKRSVMVNGVPFDMTLPRADTKAKLAVDAIEQLSKVATQNGTSEMTLAQINAEIKATRKQRSR